MTALAYDPTAVNFPSLGVLDTVRGEICSLKSHTRFLRMRRFHWGMTDLQFCINKGTGILLVTAVECTS